MSDFSDRPFVAGSLTGLRAFGVDKYGRLHGPSFTQVFRPGENVAECRKSESSTFWMPQITFTYSGGLGGVMTSEPKDKRLPLEEAWDEAHKIQARKRARESKTHVIGSLDCTCGFYAYFDGRNDFKEGHRVSAPIEGYGVCTVGLRGFRAEKARLTALITPGRKFDPTLWSYVQRNYPDVPIFERKRDALERHPLTPPPVPTPDEPDFWEREVVR